MTLLLAVNPVPTSLLTNSVLVAVIALLHTEIATFITGGMTLAALSEGISIVRGDERHERFAHSLLKSMIYVFSFGSALAIFWVLVIFTGLWGRFFIALGQITFWVLVFEAGAFVVEIALIYTVYASWERLRSYRRARLGLLALVAIVTWWQQFFIDIVASFMLTPNGGDRSIRSQFFNPTNLPLTLHRTVGNIAWAGAIVAFVAAVRYLRATAKEKQKVRALATAPAHSVGAMSAEEFSDGGAQETSSSQQQSSSSSKEGASYWDWQGQWGASFAVGMTLFQPWIGYSYAKEVQLHNYPAWYNMMFGDVSNVFLVQIGLLGLIFLLGALYFRARMRASGLRARAQTLLVGVLALAFLFAILPHHLAWTFDDVVTANRNHPFWEGGLINPYANFIPWKIYALIAFMLAGLFSLTSFLRARTLQRVTEGGATRGSQRLLLGIGVCVAMMMMVMGYIREHSRQPFLISGELRIQQQQEVNGISAGQQVTNPR
ncbi:MAG TPA: hypothetical protein VE219_00320 [Candidatus Sulfotelmatobacter sp.]|nr:hypothetical protein [Candidatus Sulfotelmatobacter sp.]